MKTKLVLVLISLLMVSCHPTQEVETMPSPSDDLRSCIAPQHTYMPGNPASLMDHKTVLPLFPWQVVTNLPTKSPSGEDYISHSLELARKNDGQDELWMKFCSEDGNDDFSVVCDYQIYRTDDQEFELLFTTEYNTQDLEPPGKLFIAQDNEVFGIRTYPFINSEISSITKFDNRFMAFVEVPDKNGLLTTKNIYRIDNYQLGNNILWMVSGHTLIGFNLDTLEAESFVIFPENQHGYLTDLTILPNGILLLSVNAQKEFIRFSMNSETILDRVPIELDVDAISPEWAPPGSYPFYATFLDRVGNIWIHDHGWMDQNGEWHQFLNRFPGFFGKLPENRGDGWVTPEIIFQSSNGTLWFRSDFGMVSLNPEDGDWCWFTTYRTDIFEDSQTNLWVVVDAKLYKLSRE